MFVIAIANNKGGCGKTTIATHVAAHYALSGKRTALADVDRQKSSLSWLKRRPGSAISIQGVDLVKDEKLPKKADILVVDGVASMRRELVQDVVKQADAILIPVLPSAFDEDGTRRFMKQLSQIKHVRKNKRDIAFIANRIKPRTRAADQLKTFLASFDYPTLTDMRDTLQYANVAADGLSLFDLRPTARLQGWLAEWTPVIEHLESIRKG